MTDTEIIEALRAKLSVAGGRHLYGVMGSYPRLETFVKRLQQAKTPEGKSFPAPLSINRGILDTIPDAEFLELVENEAKRPEPTSAHVARAFESYLRGVLKDSGLVVLSNVELLFAYGIDLSLFRTLATDDQRIIVLLPATRERGRVIMFPDLTDGNYTLPTNLIAENHLWELST
jgi:hypothetical protein